MKFENGSLVIIDNSRQAVYGYDQRVEVCGSNGSIIADNECSNTVRLYTADKTKEDNIPHFFLERYLESYSTELQYFFDCLQNNINPSPNGTDALQDVLVALAAQKSYEVNRPIKISEVNK